MGLYNSKLVNTADNMEAISALGDPLWISVGNVGEHWMHEDDQCQLPSFPKS